MSEYGMIAAEKAKKKKSGDSEDSGTAKIISNELLLVGMYSGVDKMDELTSLEREIAEMHHVEPTNLEYTGNGVINKQGLSSGKVSSLKSENVSCKIMEGMGIEESVSLLQSHCDDEGNIVQEDNGTTALEHEDLIAVLKGIDEHANTSAKEVKEIDHEGESMRSPSVTESDLAEGVTIEGEGQFQIMEVVYDESDEPESVQKDTGNVLNDIPKNLNSASTHNVGAVTPLTNEEIRAMAMEQIAGLNARGADRQRRRKQDIKPLKVEDNSDLVTSLGADWSDDDTEIDLKSASNINNTIKNKKIELDKNVDNNELLSKTSDPVSSDTNMKKLGKLNLDNTKRECNPNTGDPLKNDTSTSKPIVGFKRTRIIKPKIIWDPDAPETQISYAQFARNSSKATVRGVNESISISSQRTSSVAGLKGVRVEIARTHQVELKEKKMPTKGSLNRNETENKEQVRSTESKSELDSIVTKVKEIVPLSPTAVQSNKIQKVDEENVVKIQSPIKRRSQTPVLNGSGTGSKKKRVSEIDRLVSDEGAANMLNSLESERNKLIAEQGVDKTHKPLMRSRAATISERNLKRETTPTSGKLTAVTTTIGGVKNKRNSKQRPSSTWDYVYKQQATDDAMIIRRRSNSSYSSSASIRRLSLDAPVSKATSATKTMLTKNVQPNTTVSVTSNNSGAKAAQRSLLKTSNENNMAIKGSSVGIGAKAGIGNSFEFAKPELKSNQKGNRKAKSGPHLDDLPTSDTKKSAGASAGRRGTRSPANTDEKDKNKGTAVSSKSSVKQLKEESSAGSNISDVVVKKVAKVAQIVFNTQKAKINYTFTAQMLNKLVDILEKLSKDNECNAVVITTNAPNFCYGVDFTDLTHGTIDKRRQFAVHLAAAVKNYLKTLATFPKPLIAGVNGSNIGLGVMQLPLFDIVIGSDKGSYETPYVKIGQVPEGFCIWNNINKIRDNYKTKLFWMGEKLHSTESALSGLVHKLTASGKVNEDALLTAKKIAMMSTEAYRFMKKSIINNYLKTINNALDEEFDTIIEQWTSEECCESFKKYLESGHF
ncbi:chromodomain Y-like protein [Bactrocera dorsalis]|uniref:Chromodomain Y-like protein n=1 Tax=Bactrocera dorsalis TaxID=27457 RepID=A0A6I9W2H0_BACDO|nr:chromodomain Y-like protein [Bactrocera dorsalis]